ncbi:hypothetical protein Tco_1495504 [Tanacetum coccineum]
MPFLSEAEVERLLALPTPPLISLSPPFVEEHLARCLDAHALPSSQLSRVPHPYGSPNHVRAPRGFRVTMGRLRASSPSTHHPLHPSPPLPASLFIPPPVDHMEDIPEAELPPHPAEAVEEAALTTLKGVNARVIELAEIDSLITESRRIDQGQRVSPGDCVVDGAEGFSFSRGLGTVIRIEFATLVAQISLLQGQLSAALGQIQALQARDSTHADDPEGADNSRAANNMPPKRTSAAAVAARAAAAPMPAAAVEQLIEARVIRGAVRTPRECTYKDFLNCQPLTFKGTEGVVVLSQWFDKMELVFHISNYAMENQVKFATCTFLENALTWWNSYMKTVTQDVAYAID